MASLVLTRLTLSRLGKKASSLSHINKNLGNSPPPKFLIYMENANGFYGRLQSLDSHYVSQGTRKLRFCEITLGAQTESVDHFIPGSTANAV